MKSLTPTYLRVDIESKAIDDEIAFQKKYQKELGLSNSFTIHLPCPLRLCQLRIVEKHCLPVKDTALFCNISVQFFPLLVGDKPGLLRPRELPLCEHNVANRFVLHSCPVVDNVPNGTLPPQRLPTAFHPQSCAHAHILLVLIGEQLERRGPVSKGEAIGKLQLSSEREASSSLRVIKPKPLIFSRHLFQRLLLDQTCTLPCVRQPKLFLNLL